MYRADLKSELLLRTKKIQDKMIAQGIDACLIAGNANLYYISDRVFRGYVFVRQEGEPIYFVIRPVGLKGDNVIYIRKPEQIAEELVKLGIEMPKKLGLELDWLTFNDAKRLSSVFPEAEVCNSTGVLKGARMVKTDLEVAKMREDGRHQTAAYAKVPEIYKKGMTDLQFQIELERVLRLEGSIGFARVSGHLMEINLGSVLNGENADAPTPFDFAVGGSGVNQSLPVGANGKEMLDGTTVMVDMNGNFNGHQSDITRVWRIGKVDEMTEKAHEVSRQILREMEKMGVPGCKVADMYNRAIEIVEEAGLADYFMGHTQKAAFIGHGVGIELNEMPVLTPRSKDVLEANMTIAIEPKFVIPHVGAVGVENTYVVTSEGLENLTPFPEEMAEL